MLVCRGNLEIGKDQDDNEDVIDAQRFFYHITRQKFNRLFSSEVVVDEIIETHGQCDPDPGPYQGIPDADFL